MSPTDFQLAVLSGAVLVNIPLMAFVALQLWRLDVRLVKVETRLQHIEQQLGVAPISNGGRQWMRPISQ